MTMNNSIQLAKLWMGIAAIKDNLDNEILPAASFLGMDDDDLMIALEELSAKIQKHFEQFRLVAVANKS